MKSAAEMLTEEIQMGTDHPSYYPRTKEGNKK